MRLSPEENELSSGDSLMIVWCDNYTKIRFSCKPCFAEKICLKNAETAYCFVQIVCYNCLDSVKEVACMSAFFENLGIMTSVCIVFFLAIAIFYYVEYRKAKKKDPDAKFTAKEIKELVVIFCFLIAIGVFYAISKSLFGHGSE